MPLWSQGNEKVELSAKYFVVKLHRVANAFVMVHCKDSFLSTEYGSLEHLPFFLRTAYNKPVWFSFL